MPSSPNEKQEDKWTIGHHQSNYDTNKFSSLHPRVLFAYKISFCLIVKN
jgi:hypothetical protein